ncbi:unnamed protein product [Clonostachys byssicola]|uniref:Uncharacterized protein n=1 Tax=Clonostachys byssicola TaxID=160290 RepID=A0A9N9Y453_9HYPO|nr:unnamed protein product [Clonostachys byssicola]
MLHNQMRQFCLHSQSLIFFFLSQSFAPSVVAIPTNHCADCGNLSTRADFLSVSRIWKFDDSRNYGNGSTVDSLPPKVWKLAGSTEDNEAFRSLYNLTLVDATPQEAASMPSWPQVLFQFLVVAPPITACGFGSTQYSFFGTTITPAQFLQVVLRPSCPWHERQVHWGWMSVLGWAACYDLMVHPFEYYALPPLGFQWVASSALVIQRWVGGLGTVAYQLDSLNECVPAYGMAYLEQGARSHSFRIVQSATFAVSTLFMAQGLFNGMMVMPALTELVIAIFVAHGGIWELHDCGIGTRSRLPGLRYQHKVEGFCIIRGILRRRRYKRNLAWSYVVVTAPHAH